MNTDQQELAAYQRAIEAAKNEIAALKRHAAQAEATRALVVALDTIDRQPVGACESDFGGMPEPCESCVEMREIAKQALAAYNAAVKARGT